MKYRKHNKIMKETESADEQQNFRNLIAWFVYQLRINNGVVKGKRTSGQGYRGDKIRESYSQWRDYSVGCIDIAMQSGNRKKTEANYVHWDGTWINIVPVFQAVGDCYDVTRLRIIDKYDNKERHEYLKMSIAELGIDKFDQSGSPNENIRLFFNTFCNVLLEQQVSIYPDEIEDGSHLIEGARKQVFVNSYERNPKARAQCIQHYGASCQICGVDFSDIYGESMSGKIQVHHKIPLSTIVEEYKVNPVKDLIPVCPNCHFVLHSKQGGTYSVDEVKAMLCKT